MKAAELPGLNILRVLASLYIVFFHLVPAIQSGPAPTVLSRGTSATGLFFLLSGFLLTHLYAGKEMDEGQQRAFLWRRVARLVPANAVGLGFLLGVQALAGHAWTNWTGLTECLILVQTWVVGDSHLLNAPAWSMSCLLFFYLLFPAVLPRMLRLTTRGLIVLLVLGWLVTAIVPNLLSGVPGSFDPADWTMFLHNSPPLRSLEFVSGMGLAVLVQRRGLPSVWVLRLALPVALALMVFAPRETMPVNNGVFLPVSAALLLGFLNPGPLMERLGRTRALNAAASATIAVYLLHSTWTWVFSNLVFPRWNLHWDGWTILMYVVTVAGSALVVDRLLCRPLSRWMVRPHRPLAGPVHRTFSGSVPTEQRFNHPSQTL